MTRMQRPGHPNTGLTIGPYEYDFNSEQFVPPCDAIAKNYMLRKNYTAMQHQ